MHSQKICYWVYVNRRWEWLGGSVTDYHLGDSSLSLMCTLKSDLPCFYPSCNWIGIFILTQTIFCLTLLVLVLKPNKTVIIYNINSLTPSMFVSKLYFEILTGCGLFIKAYLTADSCIYKGEDGGLLSNVDLQWKHVEDLYN